MHTTELKPSIVIFNLYVYYNQKFRNVKLWYCLRIITKSYSSQKQKLTILSFTK